MAIITDSFTVDILALVFTLLVVLYFYLTSNFDYWEKRGVPYLKPLPLFGNMKDQFLLKKNFVFLVDDIYQGLAGHKFGGYFESSKPILMIRDPDLIERVLIKDFSHFQDRDFGLDLKSEPLAGNLFNLKGNVWKNLRNKLTPTFTSGKLKGMLEQFSNCGDDLLEEIERNLGKPVDGKALSLRYTVDVVASVSFGLQFKPDTPEGMQFRDMVNQQFAPSFKRMLEFTLLLFFKRLAKLYRARQVPKDVNDYMIDLTKKTMEYRRKNKIQRNDFLQLMMTLRDLEDSGRPINWKAELSEEDAYLNTMMDLDVSDSLDHNTKIMTDECIAAQSFVFLTGGAEATSNSIMYLLYELAVNKDVQRRLQEEIDTVLSNYNGKLTYQGLKDMEYLDMVLQEKNRKYALGGFLIRECTADYTIPDTNVKIDKGSRLVIPIHSIHHDPQYYPDPEKFIPERFEGNNFHTSGKYLPFGDGPRICIAMRFVIVEVKAAIAKIMSRYSVSLDPKMKTPIEFDRRSFILAPIGGMWLQFQKRQEASI